MEKFRQNTEERFDAVAAQVGALFNSSAKAIEHRSDYSAN